MKRLVLDMLTVVSLAALALAVTFWARSYFLRDTIGSYADVPLPAPGTLVPWEQRAGWCDRMGFSYPGRFEWVSVTTTVHDRRRGPSTQPLPASFVNAWWLDQRRSLYWRPSFVPPARVTRAGFGAWRESRSFDVEFPHAQYRESRDVASWSVSLPYWLPVVVAGVLPVARMYRAVRAGRARQFASRLSVAGSLLSLGALLVAWVHSYAVCYTLERTRTLNRPATETSPAGFRPRTSRLHSARGAVSLLWIDQHPGGPGPWIAEGARYQLESHDPNRLVLRPGSAATEYVNRLGFYLAIDREKREGRDPVVLLASVGATVPYWVLAAVLALPPGVYVWKVMERWRRERRAARGLCPQCGYDVRASGPRCPECGCVIGKPAEIQRGS